MKFAFLPQKNMDIWGEIKARLASYWESVLLHTPRIALALFIFAIFLGIATFFARTVSRRLQNRSDNRLVIAFLTRMVKLILIVTGVILALHAVGFNNIAGGLLAGAGVGTIVLGFAFKELGENFLAGVLLIFDSPFRIGDTVTVKENMGKIVELRFRTTHMKTFDGKDVYLPNSFFITNEVYNHTQDGFLRQDFVIGIDYNDDIAAATKLIYETVNDHPEILKDEQTQVLVEDFGVNTVNIRVFFWVQTLDYKIAANLLKSEVMRLVKEELSKAGFGLPANIQEFKLYNNKPIPLLIQKEE